PSTLHPPPTTTPFPYNDALPIFNRQPRHRAVQVPQHRRAECRSIEFHRSVSITDRQHRRNPRSHSLPFVSQVVEEIHNRTRDEGDRKSTRLNSSHLGTSYAVFCL